MNLPNKITLARLALIPFMILFFYLSVVPFHNVIATGIFIVAAVTDFLDGFIARKYNLVTNLGKFLDPIADKVLVISALILIMEAGLIPIIWGAVSLIVIITREFGVSTIRLLASANGKVIAADRLGKLKTVFQTIAIPFMMISQTFIAMATENFAWVIAKDIIVWSGWAFFAVSMLLTVISGISYLVKNLNVLKEKSKIE